VSRDASVAAADAATATAATADAPPARAAPVAAAPAGRRRGRAGGRGSGRLSGVRTTLAGRRPRLSAAAAGRPRSLLGVHRRVTRDGPRRLRAAAPGGVRKAGAGGDRGQGLPGDPGGRHVLLQLAEPADLARGLLAQS